MLVIFFVFLVFDSIQPFKHIYSADKNKALKGHVGSNAGAGGPHKAPPAGRKNRMLTQPGSSAPALGLTFESSVEDQDTMSAENKDDAPKPYEASETTEDASASLYTTVKPPKPYEAPSPESEVSEI